MKHQREAMEWWLHRTMTPRQARIPLGRVEVEEDRTVALLFEPRSDLTCNRVVLAAMTDENRAHRTQSIQDTASTRCWLSAVYRKAPWYRYAASTSAAPSLPSCNAVATRAPSHQPSASRITSSSPRTPPPGQHESRVD